MEVKIDNATLQPIIEAKIQAAILEALSGDTAKMVEAIVAQSLKQKADSYGNKTVLQKTVETVIQDAAKSAIQAWIAEHKALIHAAVLARLRGAKPGFVDALADKVMEGLASSFYVSATIKVED